MKCQHLGDRALGGGKTGLPGEVTCGVGKKDSTGGGCIQQRLRGRTAQRESRIGKQRP